MLSETDVILITSKLIFILKGAKMYSLQSTPVLLEFLSRFFKFAGYEFRHKKLHEKLFLYSICTCGQKDCATVSLKSKKPFKDKIQGSQVITTNKGFFIAHILKDGYFELEALCYEDFPYKKEIDSFFVKPRKVDKKYPPTQRKSRKLSTKNKIKLDKYFKNLKVSKPNVAHLGKLD